MKQLAICGMALGIAWGVVVALSVLAALYPGYGLGTFFAPVCHQIPDRSHTWAGQAFGVCIRCFWFYTGLCLGHIRFGWSQYLPKQRIGWLMLSFGLWALDWLSGWFLSNGGWIPSRVLTSLMLGIAISHFTVPGLAQILFTKPHSKSTLETYHEPDLMSHLNEDNEPDSFKAMMIGATLIFIISFIPYASLTCCLPHILGVLVTIHLFTSEYALTLTTGKGIKLGILTCLLGGVSVWVVAMGLYFGFDYQVGAKESEWMAVTMAEKFGGEEAVEQVKAALEQQKAKGLGMVEIAIGLVSNLFFACLFGLIGGAIGAAVFQRSEKSA